MAVVKSLLKYVGYTIWFVGALVVFLYLTLPLDQLESYLVRKAADEYNADLDIVGLSTWGLLGLEATGVTLTPRPSVEQLAEIAEAQARLAAWEDAEAARKGAAAAAAAAPVAGLAAGTAPDGATPEEIAKIARDVGLKPATGKTKKKAEPRPTIPDPPAPILVSVLRMGVSPWSPWRLPKAFVGRFEAELIGGGVEADVKRDAETMRVQASWNGLDLTRISVLRTALPLPLAGTLEGEVDLEVPLSDKGAPRLTAIEGHIDLKLASAELGPGRVPAKLGAFQFLDAPKTRLGDVGGRLEFEPKRRRATLQNFAFSGKDAEGEITGFIQLASSLKRFGPRLHLRIKLAEAFVKANSLSALLGASKVKKGLDEDGFLGLSMTGVIDKPSFRVQKRSPYVKAARPSASKSKAVRDKARRDRLKGKKRPSAVDRTASRTKAPARPRTTAVDKPSRLTRDKKRDTSPTAAAKLGKPTSGTSGDTEDDEADDEGDDEEEDLDRETEEEARDDAEEEEEEEEAEADGKGGEVGEVRDLEKKDDEETTADEE